MPQKPTSDAPGTMGDMLSPSVTTTETARLGDLGPNFYGGAPRHNVATGKMDSPFNKGLGYFGPLALKDGSMTEYSRTSSFDGTDVEYPLLVPTLTRDEVQWLQTHVGGNVKLTIPPSIERKAADHAMMRMQQGQSPFASADEQNLEQYSELPRTAQPAQVPDTRTFQRMAPDTYQQTSVRRK
jgi:hypothetical protein